MTNPITETIGVDLGDRYSAYSVIDQATGTETDHGRIRTTPQAFERFFAGRRTSRAVLEVGTHSPWTSRIVAAQCPETFVANPRELRFIFKNQRKSDRVDACALARVGRLDPELLSPIRHRAEPAQYDLALIRARAALVSARTKLVNSLRGLIKATGSRLKKQGAASIGGRTIDRVPECLREALQPMLYAIEALTDEIKTYDKRIDKLATESYPETGVLTQIPGVGNLTALAYMLTLEDPAHFQQSRDVGAFLGLVPRRDQSGETDKQLRITKAGDRVVRTLLVQCAHHILGRNGPPCDLKTYGERIAARGGKIAKRKAVVAVARKLAVLMHTLWRTGEVYAPDRAAPIS
jgi:transposase